MGDTGQTPVVFLLAGGVVAFSAACKAALANCGLSPDDFGSYDAVKGNIRAAKKRVMEYQLAKRRGENPPEPSARDRFLSASEAGHLRQNALFQRARGDSCQNERPRQGGFSGAWGYHHDLAPSGPHYVGTGKKEGTTHWAVGQLESEVREGRKAGAAVGHEEIQNRSLEASKLTAHGVPKKDVEGKSHHTKRRRENEAALRKECAAELKKANAQKAQGPGKVAGGKGDGPTAAECIQAYSDLSMDAMRQQVMSEYSESNYGGTKKALEKKETDAKAAKEAADKKFEDELDAAKKAPKGKGRWDEVNRAGMERSQARQDYDLAKNANASAHCLREQAKKLEDKLKKDGELPPMSGSVPTWYAKDKDKKRNTYKVPTGTKDSGEEAI